MASPSLFFSPPESLSFNNHTWTLEHAYTTEEKQKGLMFRNELLSHQAMLFIYDTPTIIPVWMKNTLIPLDILWLNAQFEILQIERGVPLSLDIMIPKQKARYFLEIPGYQSDQLGMQVGDRLVPNRVELDK